VYGIKCVEVPLGYYSNENSSYTAHDFSNDFCTRCGKYNFFYDSDGNHLISSAEELKNFADWVNLGNTKINAKLMADIDMTAYGNFAIGTSNAKYGGTFDGNGKTITIALNGGENIAPFGYLDGATIKNLSVAGTITASGKCAAGIAAHTYGDTLIEKCISSVVITSTISGDGLQDGTHGGFVGVVEGGTLTINNCAFVGQINGSNTKCCGGFVGWSAATCTIKNSYMAGTFTVDGTDSNTFARNNHTLENCYYLNILGSVAESGATQKDEAAFASGEVAWLLNGENAGTENAVWNSLHFTIIAESNGIFPKWRKKAG